MTTRNTGARNSCRNPHMLDPSCRRSLVETKEDTIKEIGKTRAEFPDGERFCVPNCVIKDWWWRTGDWVGLSPLGVATEEFLFDVQGVV